MFRRALTSILLSIGLVSTVAGSADIALSDAVAWKIPLEVAVAAAGRVALVRLVGERAASADGKTCGYVYTAAVAKSYKGPVGSFEFSSISTLSIDPGQTYFLFVFPTVSLSQEKFVSMAEYSTAEELEAVLCRLRAAPFHIPAFAKTIYKVVPAGSGVGGEWLIQDGPPSVDWCQRQAGTRHQTYPRTIRTENSLENAVSLDDISILIGLAASNFPFESSEQPQLSSPIAKSFRATPCKSD